MKNLPFNNGDAMPALGLGTWKSEKDEVYHAVRAALKTGYRHIDCAAIYLNEAEIGAALDDAFKAGDVKREELWVTSKLWNSSHRRQDVQPALEKTLTGLRLDYLDLYLVHWPVVLKPGVVFPASADDFVSLDEVPVSETWGGMEACLKAGLCRHIGVSNFSIAKLKKLLATAEYPPENNQIELHPCLPQNDMLAFCQKENILLTAYSPLGSRDRPAPFKVDDEPDLFTHPVIAGIAKNHNCTPAQVLIQWAIARGTAVIPKSVNPERIRQNLEAVKLRLTAGDMAAIAGMDLPYRFISGTFWTVEGAPYSLKSLWEE
jgi:alcohol dehydrogenase (NADP+)